MPSSSPTDHLSAVPESVTRAIASFGQGEVSLLEVRQQVLVALEEGPGRAEAIHELLDEELRARTLSIADYGELVGVVGAVVSENVPTEFSQDAPEESGVYRVIDEGTMVLAEDMPLDAAARLSDEDTHLNGADAGQVGSENDSTRPFDRELPDAPIEATLTIGPGTVLRERYRLEAEVARGAMGVVYRAVDLIKLEAKADDPYLAVKVVSPEFAGDANALRAFQNEVANTQLLSHPNIIHLFDLDRDGDQHFITMEWLEGESLAGLLDGSRASALQPTQTYAIIEQLCDALIYAHEHNVVHADVKPGNVFLLATGEVKLIDFGIAKSELDHAGDDADTVALTPAYASCERLEKAPPTSQDDLYSLACLIYRLLAGRRVFGPLTALEAEAENTELVPIGGMDDRRWNALAKALSFRREHRQADVREFSQQFGRRREPREEIAETDIGDTNQLPILNVDEAGDLIDAAELRPDLQVDFVFDEEAAKADDSEPEPELSGMFKAAANGDAGLDDFVDDSIDDSVDESAAESAADAAEARERDHDAPGEEIVLETAPTAEPVSLEQLTGSVTPTETQVDVPTDEPVAPQPAVLRQDNSRQKLVAGGAIAAVIVAGIAVAILFGGDEPAPPRQVAAPAAPESRAAVADVLDEVPLVADSATESAAAATGELVGELNEETVGESPVVSDVEVVAEPAVEPVIEPAAVAVVAAEPAAEPEPVEVASAEPAAEPEPVEIANTEPAAEPEPVQVATAVTESEPAAQAEAVDASAAAALATVAAVAVTESAPAVVESASLAAAPTVAPVEAQFETAAEAEVEAEVDSPQSASADTATETPVDALPDDAAAAPNEASEAIESAPEPPVAAAGFGALVAAAVEPARTEPAPEPEVPEFDPRQLVPLSELEFINYSEPKFPRMGDGRRYDGWVDVEFRVGTDGRTRSIEVIGSDLPTRFESPSINAVKKWRFEPYEVNGSPVAVYSAVRLRFAN